MGAISIFLDKRLKALGYGTSNMPSVFCEGEEHGGEVDLQQQAVSSLLLPIKHQISTDHSVPLQIQENLKLSANRVNEMKLKEIKR